MAGGAVIDVTGGRAHCTGRQTATPTIPIVISGDPLKAGLVASFNRPGGNVTGITLLSSAKAARQPVRSVAGYPGDEGNNACEGDLRRPRDGLGPK